MNRNNGTPQSYWIDMYTSWLSLALFTQASGDGSLTNFFLEQSSNAEYMVKQLNSM